MHLNSNMDLQCKRCCITYRLTMAAEKTNDVEGYLKREIDVINLIEDRLSLGTELLKEELCTLTTIEGKKSIPEVI